MAVSRAQVKKRQRMYILGLAMLAIGGAVALTLTAVEDSISLFYSPAQLVELEGRSRKTRTAPSPLK